MTSDLLATRHCVPCESGTPPLTRAEAGAHTERVPAWKLVEGEKLKIQRRFKFKDFVEAMAFVNRVAGVAESEGHHPDIRISWNRVTLDLLTHAIGGLSENDFIMAAKIDELEQPEP